MHMFKRHCPIDRVFGIAYAFDAFVRIADSHIRHFQNGRFFANGVNIVIDNEHMQWLERVLPFWNDLEAGDRELVLSSAQYLHYPHGTLIHGGASDCIGLILIQSGTLRTYILSEEGRDITLFRLYQNDLCILSASCIIKQITFDVHIEAESDCDVLVIGAATMAALSEKNIHVENFSYKLTTDRFSEVMWALQQILFLGFDKRLAVFLIDETAKNGSNLLQITHEQIAKYTGSAREVVTRMLKRFQEEGLVHLARGMVEVLDKARLRALL